MMRKFLVFFALAFFCSNVLGFSVGGQDFNRGNTINQTDFDVLNFDGNVVIDYSFSREIPYSTFTILVFEKDLPVKRGSVWRVETKTFYYKIWGWRWTQLKTMLGLNGAYEDIETDFRQSIIRDGRNSVIGLKKQQSGSPVRSFIDTRNFDFSGLRN